MMSPSVRFSKLVFLLTLFAGVALGGIAPVSAQDPSPQDPSARDQSSQDRPNVVLIMADDVGYEAFGAFGSEQYETPHIDALAREGMRFTRAYSQPLCTPSRVEIMTGQSNVRNYRAFGILGPRERTFAHVLKQAGYSTAVAGKWQLFGSRFEREPVQRRGMHPEASGFDEYALWQVWRRPSRYWKPGLLVNGQYQQFGEDQYGPDVCADFLLDFIEEHREGPFFAYFPTSLPHSPLHWPPGRRGSAGTGSEGTERARAEQAKFEAMVRHLDKLVGRITAKIDALGLTEETLILFTSDNGSPGGIRSRLHGQAIEGGKGQTTEAGMRVPLVARMPGTVPAGTVVEDLVGFSDVLPTFADLAGAPAPAEPIDGVSFAPQLRGQEGAPRPWLFSYYVKGPYRSSLGEAKRFAWDQQWKLYSDGRLFHIAEDPREETALEPGNESPEARAAREKLQGAIDAMPSSLQTLMPPDSVNAEYTFDDTP